jgi:hypothetical protein
MHQHGLWKSIAGCRQAAAGDRKEISGIYSHEVITRHQVILPAANIGWNWQRKFSIPIRAKVRLFFVKKWFKLKWKKMANTCFSVTIYRRVPDTPSKKGAPKCSVASALQESEGIARGFRLKEGEPPGALNGFLYSLLRGTKQQRRALVLSMLKQFDENSKNPLAQLLYLADNLAAFPYQVGALVYVMSLRRTRCCVPMVTTSSFLHWNGFVHLYTKGLRKQSPCPASVAIIESNFPLRPGVKHLLSRKVTWQQNRQFRESYDGWPAPPVVSLLVTNVLPHFLWKELW